MKRSAIVALSVFFVTTLSGAETQRYLVATQPVSNGSRFAVETTRIPDAVEPRAIERFSSVHGFAADLTDSEVETLRRTPGVRYVEPIIERQASDVAREIGKQTTPYGVNMLRAPLAWSAQSAARVNVVVIDSGVDYRHPELQAAWSGGYDFVNNDDDPMDDNGHGTHVAGTILARNDHLGVVGVAPDAHLYGLKVLNAQGTGKNESLILALDWILKKKQNEGGHWIANLSLGAPEMSQLEREAFVRAIDNGVIIVAASGNSSTSAVPAPVQFPAAYPGVVAVGAVNDARKIGTFSCQGPELDFVAPGVAVLSTVRVGTDEVSFLKSEASSFETTALVGSRKGEVTAPYAYVGLGKEGEITASNVRGKIALIRRGEISFGEKAKRAKEAGAIAVAIFNNDDPYQRSTLISEKDPSTATYDWPVTISMRKSEGEALAAQGTGVITVAYIADDYGEKTGTSMASPHVAGAAAFLWSLAPNATATTILNAMTTTATDLGAPGQDVVYGAGLVDVFAAAKQIAPGAFSTGVGRRRSAGS